MQPKNKKGKASKLARMSDEERSRYLQHRAEVELETKRRKQQLIVIFTKNKLKREEAFARINTAKLNEQWRLILRKVKCTKLKDNIEYLWQNFEEILKMKDNFIRKLLDGLLEVNYDHKRFQEAHIMAIDNIIEKGQERKNNLRNNYNKCIKIIETVDIEDLWNYKVNIKEFLKYLETIIFAKNKFQEKEISKIKIKHSINIHSILYDKSESILKLKQKIHPIIESLWKQLNDIITNYENLTENIRNQYEYLKKQDEIHQIEITHFPKFHSKLKQNVEILNKNFITAIQEREESNEDMRMQFELLTKGAFKVRQEIKMTQTIDTVQLKRLSVITNKTIKNLQRILGKSRELQTLEKLCLDMKLDSFSLKKYSSKNFNDTGQLIKLNDISFDILRKIEGFRVHLYNVKQENNLMKQKRNNLIEENNRLKHCLRSYLETASRIPTINSITYL